MQSVPHLLVRIVEVCCECGNNDVPFHFRYGLRGRELVSSVGKIMLQGGGTFGVFMSVGTAIRC